MKNTISLILLLLCTFQISAQENENEKEELSNEEMAVKNSTNPGFKSSLVKNINTIKNEIYISSNTVLC